RVALVLALAIRAVPVVAGLASEVRDAQRARGIAADPRSFAVPFVVRSLRHADALGEALAARGLDDEASDQ
ncbi:MAG TPA: energy-coupling factor transporter transmembrane component T, partial [Jiangellaceae bacterium]|nr:energy-coupling factor transporter transmembrane component T [Jiangellaceae bacterium]